MMILDKCLTLWNVYLSSLFFMTKALAKSLHIRIRNTSSASESKRTVQLIRRKMRLKEGHAKCYLKNVTKQ